MINGRELKSHPGKKNQLANTVLKDQVMEMQSKCGHPHDPLVSLRMLKVKSPGEKSSPNTGTSLIIPCERQPSQGLGVLTGDVGVSQSFDPDFSSPQLLSVQGHLNSMGALHSCSASAFCVPQMHRANPNNFEPSVLHSSGVF